MLFGWSELSNGTVRDADFSTQNQNMVGPKDVEDHSEDLLQKTFKIKV